MSRKDSGMSIPFDFIAANYAQCVYVHTKNLAVSMSATLNMVLAGVAVAFMCVAATAAGKRQADHWSFYHFDGSRFVAGQPGNGTAFVAVRDGVRPVVLRAPAAINAVELVSGTGAIAGICYIQSSGGKLARGPAYLPCSRMTVQISAGDKVVATTETDEQGYFLATLAAGRYRVSSRETIEVTVENGTTLLVPLRAGKRMVD